MQLEAVEFMHNSNSAFTQHTSMSKHKSKRPLESASAQSNGNVQDAANQSKLQPRPSFEKLRDQIGTNLKRTNQKKGNGRKHEGKPSDRRGKKRDAAGNVLSAPLQINVSNGALNEEDEFLAEVQALGGGREDVMFLADVQSDSELEGDEIVQVKAEKQGKNDLTKGMDNILREIALAQGTTPLEPSADPEPDDSEEEVESPPSSEAGDQAATPPLPAKVADRKGKDRTPLKVEPQPEWFAISDAFKDIAVRAEPDRATAQAALQYGQELLARENDQFKNRQQSSSQSFYNTVIQSGTLSDKISALTLAVQESPIHNVKALEALLGLASKRSRSQAVDVLRALKDLFAQGSLMPADRRLYAFATHPGFRAKFGKKSWTKGQPLPKGVEEAHLMAWAFEDWLKEQYFEILKILETWSNDEIEFAKARAISYVYELLKEKPEQEANLLRLLINKLGDPVKKVASQASYLLMQLLTAHPAMKTVVISAIETDFIFKPGQSLHAIYYATVTLNQTALSSQEEQLAIRLLDIYFSLFSNLIKTTTNERESEEVPASMSREHRRRLLKKKNKAAATAGQAQTDELRDKLTSALLTGVNRAYPYAGADNKSFVSHLDTLFKIVHSANFNTCVQAMLLIQQLSATHVASNDRFYRVLYESLLDQRLIAASKQQMYLNLLHRALKADLNATRVRAFVKRILQILSLHEPPFICGAFFLLKDLDSSFPGLATLVDEAEEDEDDGEEVFRDVDDDRGARLPVNKEEARHYDGHKRAPEHANANKSSAWELLPFLAHFHPSVAISTEHYMRHQKLPGKADLTLHTLIHFLDRFVYKNAKLSEGRPRGASIMQPMASDHVANVLIAPTVGGSQRAPVTSDDFRTKQDKDVAADEVFFHKYFANLGKEAKPRSKKQKVDHDAEIGSEDEDDVWNAMMKSAPELEGIEESDDDLSMSDLESAMGSEDDEMIATADEGGDEDVDVESGIFDDSDGDEAGGSGGYDEEMPDFGEIDSDDEVDENDEVPEEIATTTADKKGKPEKRGKKFKSLPVFASVDDYEKLLGGDGDEDLG
jgi:ribosome biogenesis protein MAK21